MRGLEEICVIYPTIMLWHSKTSFINVRADITV